MADVSNEMKALSIIISAGTAKYHDGEAYPLISFVP